MWPLSFGNTLNWFNNKIKSVLFSLSFFLCSGKNRRRKCKSHNRENVQIWSNRQLWIWVNTWWDNWVLWWRVCVRQWKMRSTKREVRPARRLRGRDGRGVPGTSELLNVQERRYVHASRGRRCLLVPERIFRAKLPASVGEDVQLAVQWRELCWAEEESCFPARWFCRPLWGLLPVCL